MKRILLFFSIVFCVGMVYAGKQYTVTVTYEIINKYYDENNALVSSQSVGTQTAKFQFYAETPDEAETMAKRQCNSACSIESVYQGKQLVGNKNCDVYQERRVISARAI